MISPLWIERHEIALDANGPVGVPYDLDAARLDEGRLIIIVGLAFEARIAAGPRVHVVCAGDSRDLASNLTSAIRTAHSTMRECQGLVSFGVAGGLAPHLRSGDCVVGTEIIFGSNSMPTDRDWSQRLLGVIPNAVPGVLLGVLAPVARREEKRDLFIKTGAGAVDMESHIVAAVGLAHGLPVATIRVITDPAQRTLTRSAATAMRPDGTINIGAIVWSVLKSPSEISGLVLTAVDACAARASLVRGRYWLGLLQSSPRAAFAGSEFPNWFETKERFNSSLATTSKDDMGFRSSAVVEAMTQ